MTNSSFLALVLFLLAVLSPIAAAWPPFTECYGDATYAANSPYEANLRRLAAVVTAAVTASHGSYTHRAFGFWPNRVQATALCGRRHDDEGNAYISGIICEDGTCYDSHDDPASHYSSCADCIADAFRELESSCRYHKQAYFFDRNCTLHVNEAHMLRIDIEANMLKKAMVSGLIFQAIGFAWLFFLLLQEWRGRKRDTAS